MTETAPNRRSTIRPKRLEPSSLQLDRYEVLSRIGGGALGLVYLAIDRRLGRRVALKVPRPGVSAPLELVRECFLREARAAARLEHPGIITVHDVGDDPVFIAMEFVPGPTLARWQRRARSCGEVLDVFRHVGGALSALHDNGMIHRDIKPSNIIVATDRVPQIIDFGLATSSPLSRGARVGRRPVDPDDPDATLDGPLGGTPAYMAPEQLAGTVADEASDQFSLCASLFEALFGRRPFPNTADGVGYLSQVRSGPRWFAEDEARAPVAVLRAVRRGLRADPAERHDSVGELIRSLSRGGRPTARSPGLSMLGG